VLVVIAIIAILISLLVPAVQKVREAAARVQCANNLKQLGLGLHGFHDVNRGFPPAKQTKPTNQGWIQFILPHIDQQPLFSRYRFELNWDDAKTNDADPGGANQTVLTLLLCPSAPGGRLASRHRGVTDYDAMNQITRPNPFVVKLPPSDSSWIGILGLDVRRHMNEILDGTSNTILLAESAGRNQLWQMGKMVATSGTTGAWANPGTAIVVTGFDPTTSTLPGPCAVNCTNNNEVYAFHTGLANMLFADGSVRPLRAGLNINMLIPLMTRAIGEVTPPGALD